MRYVERLPEPEILTARKQQWTQQFLASGKKRPDHSKYGNVSIRGTLDTMSFHKCFYCERKLKNIPQEIDHYVEVAEWPQGAFEWENLYLACEHCNNKFANLQIPNAQTLNPCIDSDEEIAEHLDFEDEFIRANRNSAKGYRTIQKYKLDSPVLDHVRLEQIKLFHQVLLRIKDSCIADGRKEMNDAEKNVLRRFAQKDYPFSLMFKRQLARFGIV